MIQEHRCFVGLASINEGTFYGNGKSEGSYVIAPNLSRNPRYSGLLTLKNSARAHTMNNWPTFSSVDILLIVLRTHFSPARSR